MDSASYKSVYLLLEQGLIDQNHFVLLILEGWFETLQEVLSKHKLFDRQNAIFNVDETGFLNDPGRRPVVVRRSTKHMSSHHNQTQEKR